METEAIAALSAIKSTSAQLLKSTPFLILPAGTINAAGGRCLSPLVTPPLCTFPHGRGGRVGEKKISSSVEYPPSSLSRLADDVGFVAVGETAAEFRGPALAALSCSSLSVLARRLIPPSLPSPPLPSFGVEKSAAFSGFGWRSAHSSSCVDCLRLARRQRHDSSGQVREAI